MNRSSWTSWAAPIVTLVVILALGAVLVEKSKYEGPAQVDPEATATTVAPLSSSTKKVVDAFEADFPEGVALPDLDQHMQDLVDRTGTGSVTFQDGFVDGEVLGWWRCSWERVYWLALTSDDEDGAAKARAQIDRYYDLETTKKVVSDPDHRWYADVIKPVDTGDTTHLRDDLRGSCGKPFRDGIA